MSFEKAKSFLEVYQSNQSDMIDYYKEILGKGGFQVSSLGQEGMIKKAYEPRGWNTENLKAYEDTNYNHGFVQVLNSGAMFEFMQSKGQADHIKKMGMKNMPFFKGNAVVNPQKKMGIKNSKQKLDYYFYVSEPLGGGGGGPLRQALTAIYPELTNQVLSETGIAKVAVKDWNSVMNGIKKLWAKFGLLFLCVRAAWRGRRGRFS